MNILGIEAHPVRVPRLRRFLPKTAHGESIASEYVILRIMTQDGIEGLGEVTCSPRWNGEEAAGTVDLIRNRVSPAVKGLDPGHVAVVMEAVDREFRDRPFLRAGIEMACLDAAAKSQSVTVVDLLGGALRRSISTKLVLPARDEQTVADMAADLRQYGLPTVKVKVGTGVEADVIRVSRVHSVLGDDARLTVDANEGWELTEAMQAIPQIREHGVLAVEQPLKRTAWRSCARLQALTGVPLVGDESIWTLDDIQRCSAAGSFDVVSLYPGKCGGLRRTLELARLARQQGLGVTMGSNLELGVGSAAMAHTAAALEQLSELVPSDLIGPLYFEDSLIEDPSFVRWGSASIPSGLGLGVSLNHDAVERFQIDY